MNSKSGKDQSAEQLPELNKKILEVKKKIQLSDIVGVITTKTCSDLKFLDVLLLTSDKGQRKALFEDCENERKSNAEEIINLKKDISEVIVKLYESKSIIAKHRIKDKTFESMIGPLAEKSCNEVQNMLDLQIIDKTKKIDLLRYRTKQRKKYLAELAMKYQKLLMREDKKELNRKVEQPVKKSTSELQNNIHAVDVQLREALHIKNRYTDIYKSLKKDSDNFESSIKQLEEQLEEQQADINSLHKIMMEAARMRSIARATLHTEEKAVNLANLERDKEAAEGRRLVSLRKNELEQLEKKIFQGGKMPQRSEPDGAEDAPIEDEKSPTPTHPVEKMVEAFEVLKQATGGTSTEEVLQRFQSQKDTEERLTNLRESSEFEKLKLEKKMEFLVNKFNSFKYAEVKDAERKSNEMERMQLEIEKHRANSHIYQEEKTKKIMALKSLGDELHTLYLCINPSAYPNSDSLETLKLIETSLKTILQKINNQVVPAETEKVSNVDIQEEKWLPAPYNGLVRTAPVCQPGSSPVPQTQGSDEEEEVPSRGYLKRQAQLVVDAKSRRKNVRIQLPKRN